MMPHAPDPVEKSAATRLLADPVQVINVGLPAFAHDLAALGVGVIHVDWAPPAGGDPELGRLLAKLGS